LAAGFLPGSIIFFPPNYSPNRKKGSNKAIADIDSDVYNLNLYNPSGEWRAYTRAVLVLDMNIFSTAGDGG
jgi:hypothetical protein